MSYHRGRGGGGDYHSSPHPFRRGPHGPPRQGGFRGHGPFMAPKPRSGHCEVMENPHRYLEVDQQKRVLHVSLCGQLMQDRDLDAFCRYLDTRMSALRTEFQLGELDAVSAVFDASENSITDEGVKTLTTLFDTWRIHVHILKLYRNQITDKGAKTIANYIYLNPHPVLEVHLSHNQLTDEGMKHLLWTFAKHEGYPAYPNPMDKFDNVGRQTAIQEGIALGRGGNRRWVPVWLRLENNNLTDVDALFDWMRENEVTYCIAHPRDPHCTARACKLAEPGRAEIKVHLPSSLIETSHRHNMPPPQGSRAGPHSHRGGGPPPQHNGRGGGGGWGGGSGGAGPYRKGPYRGEPHHKGYGSRSSGGGHAPAGRSGSASGSGSGGGTYVPVVRQKRDREEMENGGVGGGGGHDREMRDAPMVAA
ncbi:unnamed protein product [Vitrella brassicaformis CCMP3155]|uniref:Uncharacterized protein n=2 Tax=Vitrella brassicaformis TaxID=1169539 RepID=A0A0G4H694_VITBC|nr:unnamed protein product [Vitrella brassicaformis CCMP3155]|eukprot:CEM39379.1 unnamed protein product [Vitrella brassicaformis CCMP3155]